MHMLKSEIMPEFISWAGNWQIWSKEMCLSENIIVKFKDWRELELCQPICIGQETDVGNHRIYELLDGVNSGSPSIDRNYIAFLQGEEDCSHVMLGKDQRSPSQEQSGDGGMVWSASIWGSEATQNRDMLFE